MKRNFQLTALAIAVTLSATGAYADNVISDIDNVIVNVDTNDGGFGAFSVVKGVSAPVTLISSDVNRTTIANQGGNSLTVDSLAGVTVNVQTSTVLAGGAAVAGQDLIIPTVNAGFANTTQTFNQNRIDTEVGQVRNVGTQIYDQNKLQFGSSEQTGDQSRTTPQSATATYDANGVIVAGSLNGPVLGATVDNGFVPTSVNKVQELTLGRNNINDDYALNITKTDNGNLTATTVAASGISTGAITLNGADLATTIVNSDAATLASANQNTANTAAAIRSELAAGDNATLASANQTTANTATAIRSELAAGDVATLASANQNIADTATVLRAQQVAGDAATLASANQTTASTATTLRAQQVAGDTATLASANQTTASTAAALRSDISTRVTTNALEVNGPTNLNGPVTINNVSATTTVDQAGTPVTVPSFGTALDAEGRPTTLVQNREKTDIVTVDSTTQNYNQNNLTFSSKVEKGSIKTNETFTAGITYDANGVATYGQNTPLGVTADPQLEVVSEDTIILGKESASGSNGLIVRNKDANGVSTSTALTAAGIATTGNLSVDGLVTGAGFDARDAITLASANQATADTAVAIRNEVATESARVNTAISSGDATTLASANQTTAVTAAAIRTEATAETTRVNTAISTGDAATLASANKNTADTAVAIRGEAATEATRVNSAISTGNASTLASSKAYTDTSSATTLAAANSYTDSRANQMNHRLDDIEKTAYRGVAIALAAQQAIPNLKPGNFAVYGGIGHYEGENAGALGVATLLGNGRTSINAAFGFASSQVGGRVGVSYVFGD